MQTLMGFQGGDCRQGYSDCSPDRAPVNPDNRQWNHDLCPDPLAKRIFSYGGSTLLGSFFSPCCVFFFCPKREKKSNNKNDR